MGIIEFHLHEPEFEFAPSMSRGENESSEDSDTESLEAIETDSGESDGSGGSGMGKFVALGVLVALGALMGWRRRRGGSEPAEEMPEEEEIEISA